MTYTPKVTPSKTTAALAIEFVIVGGGISGLACAVALRRVGHRVTVLEKHSNINQAIGGCRLAPNLSKILFHWGLEQDVKRIGMNSKGIDFLVLETGEKLGYHTWDEEVIKETRGEFIFSHHSDLRKLLYDTALDCGAKVRLGAAVTEVDPENRQVTLSTGEIIRADVIVGADGVNGVCRMLMVEEDEVPEHRNNLYSTVVPSHVILDDPAFDRQGSERTKMMFSWFGNGKSVLAYPVGGSEEFAIMVYCPVDGNEATWEDKAPLAGLQKILMDAEPRVQKIAKAAAAPACVPVSRYPEPEDWVHDSGRLVLIGEAVHPLPPGCIQEAAMTVEDGAVLAKLFSHLRTEDQIESFLYAFQDLRKPRCDGVLTKELGDVGFMTLPPGDYQEGRDASFRLKRDAGVGVLESLDKTEDELPQWAEIKDLFGYDAEDEADDWWVEWGLLRERARGTDVSQGFVQHAMVMVNDELEHTYQKQ
ncbi:FAD/NAD(P)-binding domain-containing protein [Coprinopsis marcescibilis]|uniref:FAD/NAD(P)-binding domain-containing protein n=1 Tax=Coprinopsis marcescibilis TaxID=230819 RepID=A0A5C3KFL5_COPMA|nr:FAD/NAD(P)-binding domain-containing protein [Coprinopsis marcescibilis]